MNNFFGYCIEGGWSVPPRWLFPKTAKVYISMSSDHIDGSAIRFFFDLKVIRPIVMTLFPETETGATL